ncbi:conserved hypothetical protein, partial [Ricinus communis]
MFGGVGRVGMGSVELVFLDPAHPLAGRIVERRLRRRLGIRVRADEGARGGDLGGPPPAGRGHGDRGGRLDVGNRIEPALDRRVDRRAKEDQTALLVDGFDLVDRPVTLGHLREQLAVGGVVIEVLVPRLLRRPEERAVLQGAEVVVQLHPMRVGLGQDDLALAARRAEGDQIEGLLIAALALDIQGLAVLRPSDAGQVDVLVCAQVDLHHLARGQVLDEQFDDGVRAAGARIALVDHGGARRADVGARHDVDAALVDAGVGDQALVRRPPVAGVAVHLLLGDELGHAERQGALALGGDRGLFAAGQRADIEVLVAHVRDEPALGRNLGVDLVAGGLGQAGHLAVGDAVDIEVAVQRHEHEAALAVPAVFDHAAGQHPGALATGQLGFRQRLVARRQGVGVDQPVGLAALHVHRPQVLY